MGSSPKAPGPTASQLAAERRQDKEYKETERRILAKKDALKRRSRGRASLISGDETGITDKTLLG